MMRVMRAIAVCGVLAACGASAAPKVEKPRLIVAIAVDQLSSDIFNEYRATYTGGLKRLMTGGVFPAGFQSHAATETCPGHSTILTGARPARSGIIANSWINPAKSRKGAKGEADYGVYCSEDPDAPDTSSARYVVSSGLLKVPTLGDRLKAISPATQVVGVSGKDRGAVMMAGHKADLTLWWGKDGFETYKGRERDVPASLAAVNARAKALIAKPTAQKLPAHCASHARAVPLEHEVAGRKLVGTLNTRKAGDARSFRATPDLDALTAEAAIAALNDRKLGQGSATDVLAVSFSATDYIGHTYGTAGAETCAQVAALDATLGRLFAALDKTKLPYAVVLTSDHGGHDLPERNRQNGLPGAERVDMALMPQILGPMLQKAFDLPEPALLGDGVFGDLYLSAKIPADKRSAVQDAALTNWRKHRQIAAVFTKAQLIEAPAPSGPPENWSLQDKAKASFDPERSGDFVVFLKENVTPIPSTGFGIVATHGSPWNYDRRVPILFWWKGMAPFEQPNGVETVDILPTLAGLIGLKVPKDEIDGRCLDLLPGAESSC